MKLSWELLLEAYQLGYFPMGESRDGSEIVWVKPEYRGIFPLDSFHVPRSLGKTLRRDPFDIRLDTVFTEVILACAQPRAGDRETWINDEIIRAYGELHRRGYAHSVEAWREGELVGGLYGVSIGGAFFGESMFSRATDASKIALCHLVGRMKMAGYSLLDTQFLNPHLARFGAVEMPARSYSAILADALGHHASLADYRVEISGSAILQSITQTS